MGKPRKSKGQNNPTGSNNSSVSKKGAGSKKEQQNSKSETVDREEAKKSKILSVTGNTEVNAEEETSWDSKVPEDFDQQLENHKANVITTGSLKDDKVQTPSGSKDKTNSDEKPSRVTKPNYDVFDRNTKKKSDAEFDNFMKLLDAHGNIEYTKVTEIEKDLFSMSNDYSLAHCVAEDLNMGSGIAVQFSSQFKRHGELSNQKQKQGGLAILSIPPRFIYYLVTKKYSSGKPNLQTMWNSLTKMQQHVQANNVKQVAVPRIGCGLDRLDWSHVKFMMEYIFKDTDVEITVCNFQQEDSTRKVIQKCKIFNVPYPLVEIEAGTMIVYFGTEDGYIDNTMEELDKKFRILPDYKRGPRALGQVVQTEAFNGNYLLFGFIVKKLNKDALDYEYVQKCTQEVNKINKKFKNQAYQYLALDMLKDPPDDDLQFNKVLNILRSTMSNVDVYVCYPKDLKHLMPRERERSDF